MSQKIASETGKDSASMKTIAALTMLFLPATFLATMFDMPFFKFSNDSLSVSRQLWVYVVVAVVTTLTLFVLWWAWTPGSEYCRRLKPWLRCHLLALSFKKLLRAAYRRLGSLFRGRPKKNTLPASEAHSLGEVGDFSFRSISQGSGDD